MGQPWCIAGFGSATQMMSMRLCFVHKPLDSPLLVCHLERGQERWTKLLAKGGPTLQGIPFVPSTSALEKKIPPGRADIARTMKHSGLNLLVINSQGGVDEPLPDFRCRWPLCR
jgi:hypothetical protein